MLTFAEVRDIILDELRAKGYAPNPADVSGAVAKLMELHKAELEAAKGADKETGASKLIDKPPVK